jgi:small subunit ribosomal protein S3
MGQKVHPVAFRVGVMLPHRSRWYASKKEFAGLLLEDSKIRTFIKKHPKKNYSEAGIDRIEIERTRDEVKIVLYVARPGLIIGKKGQDVEILQEELQNLTGRRVNLKIEELNRPEIMAQLVAEGIARDLAKRASFRRTLKRAMETTMDAGAKGIKIQLAGRLGGSEMARCEKATSGSLPLSTLRANINYGFAEASTAQGNIGVQVWVNHGMFGSEVTSGADAQAGEAPKKPKRAYKR